MKKNVMSVLLLDKLVFDKIEFNRLGMKNENEETFQIQGEVRKKADQEVFRVTLTLRGKKEDEYTMEIAVSGYFSFDDREKITECQKNDLINKNAVAILMPYLRSEVSLLTAQPEVDCVVLPPFNINKMLNDNED